jgi:hypothetical protein
MQLQNLSLAGIVAESKAGENDAVRAFAPLMNPQINIPQPEGKKPKPEKTDEGKNKIKVIEEGIQQSEDKAKVSFTSQSSGMQLAENANYLQTFLKVFGIGVV